MLYMYVCIYIYIYIYIHICIHIYIYIYIYIYAYTWSFSPRVRAAKGRRLDDTAPCCLLILLTHLLIIGFGSVQNYRYHYYHYHYHHYHYYHYHHYYYYYHYSSIWLENKLPGNRRLDDTAPCCLYRFMLI